MSKLEVEFEITGLRFKISGERDTVPAALASIQRQVASLAQSVASAATAFDGNAGPTPLEPPVVEATRGALPAAPVTQPSQKRSRKNGNGRKETTGAIDFKHDAEKVGFPKQEWNTATKAMWLLYVLEQSSAPSEASASALAATFNKYFKASGTIQSGNITRDLGAAKGKSGFVNSDPTKDPEVWFLLTSGKTHIQQLLANPNGSEASVAQ